MPAHVTHLAGTIAVTVADRMGEQGNITGLPDGGELSAKGVVFLRSVGVDGHAALNRTTARRLFAPLPHWSERRPQIAGTGGAALLNACFEHDWMRRTDGSRAISITQAGALALNVNFGIKSGEQ